MNFMWRNYGDTALLQSDTSVNERMWVSRWESFSLRNVFRRIESKGQKKHTGRDR